MHQIRASSVARSPAPLQPRLRPSPFIYPPTSHPHTHFQARNTCRSAAALAAAVLQPARPARFLQARRLSFVFAAGNTSPSPSPSSHLTNVLSSRTISSSRGCGSSGKICCRLHREGRPAALATCADTLDDSSSNMVARNEDNSRLFVPYSRDKTQITGDSRSEQHRHVSRGEQTSKNNDRPAFMITTPIFYVNGPPHVGHLFSVLLADAQARWRRLHGYRVLFSTGTDEHGGKVQRAAAAAGYENSPAGAQELADQVSAQFRHLFNLANISYDDFIRTTEQRHLTAVQELWRRMMERGDLYADFYRGWYSVSDEEFVAEADTALEKRPETGDTVRVSVETGNVVEWVEELNFKFRLTKYAPGVLEWIIASEEAGNPVVEPANRREEIKQLLAEMIQSASTEFDLSVSRPLQRIPFGIPVPTMRAANDEEERVARNLPEQSIYVWLDALANYLTIAGFGSDAIVSHDRFHSFWPPDMQFLGKDIMKFHAIYWPAFLLSALSKEDIFLRGSKSINILPKKLLAHGHWLIGGKKMAKSRGNVIDPISLMENGSEPADFWRYMFLTECRSLSEDSTFPAGGVDAVHEKIRKDLVATYGNLFMRSVRIKLPVLEPKAVQRSMSWDTIPEAESLIQKSNALYEIVSVSYDAGEFATGSKHVLRVLHDANGFFEHTTPWLVAKEATSTDDIELAVRAHQICYIAQEVVRICSLYLVPIIPERAAVILAELGVDSNLLQTCFVGGNSNPILKIGWRKQVLAVNKTFVPFDVAAKQHQSNIK